MEKIAQDQVINGCNVPKGGGKLRSHRQSYECLALQPQCSYSVVFLHYKCKCKCCLILTGCLQPFQPLKLDLLLILISALFISSVIHAPIVLLQITHKGKLVWELTRVINYSMND